MKKFNKVLVSVIALIALMTLASCGSNKLPEWADTDTLTENAQILIDTLNRFDYEGVAEIYNNPAVTAATFEESGELVSGMGTFTDYGAASFFTGKTDSGQEYVKVIQIANYEHGKLTFTISFFEDGSVAGFYVKA